MTKKMIIAVAIALCAFATFARPHGGPGFGGPRGGFGRGPAPMMHHRPMPPPMHHHHHHSSWGHGGRNFWPGFVGGVIGGALTSSIYPTTTVVTAPVVSTPIYTTPTIITAPIYTTPVQVWIPGRYIDQVQPNGTIVRVWVAGHYEYR